MAENATDELRRNHSQRIVRHLPTHLGLDTLNAAASGFRNPHDDVPRDCDSDRCCTDGTNPTDKWPLVEVGNNVQPELIGKGRAPREMPFRRCLR